MQIPPFSAADFATGMQNLLPRGAIWPRDPDASQSKVIAALTQIYGRQAARSLNLLTDAFPIAPVELLPEWEESLGLPDPCAGAQPTIQLRQQQVNARFIAGGGQSVPFFIGFAAALGYPITITEFAPSRFGLPFGLPFGGVEWASTWQVNAPTFTIEGFEFGHDAFGEPFASWGSTTLLCEMERISPAHTILLLNGAATEAEDSLASSITGTFSADGSFSVVLPAGALIIAGKIAPNTTSGATVSLGTTSGGSDILAATAVPGSASGPTPLQGINFLQTIFGTNQTIFAHSPSWASMTITIWFVGP